MRIKAKLPKYFELKPTCKHSDLFLVRSIHIDQCGETNNGLTCPAKTIVIFAHNEDFPYDQLPQLMQTANKCLSLEDVRRQQDLKQLPPSCFYNRSSATDGKAPIQAFIELFDT